MAHRPDSRVTPIETDQPQHEGIQCFRRGVDATGQVTSPDAHTSTGGGHALEKADCACLPGLGAHSFTSFLRRTSAMKKGAPNTAIMMPTSSSAGRATIRPSTSATSSRAAPSRPEYGSSQR